MLYNYSNFEIKNYDFDLMRPQSLTGITKNMQIITTIQKLRKSFRVLMNKANLSAYKNGRMLKSDILKFFQRFKLQRLLSGQKEYCFNTEGMVIT